MDLTDSDFESKLASFENSLVMFYAPWCGHCKRMKPEFEKAADILAANDPPVQLIKVDCTEGGKDSCSKYGVSGYPTLKQFTFGAAPKDYNGPREVAGIVKHMKSQVGPASKELSSKSALDEFLAKKETTVVFCGDDETLKGAFLKTASLLRESVAFGHSSAEDVLTSTSNKNKVVLTRPAHLKNKFEPSTVVYDGEADASSIKSFIKANYHGLVGHRTTDTVGDFNGAVVVAYYNVDYDKNVKSTNYWRNRVLKIAQNYKEDFTFAVSDHGDFTHELEEYGKGYVDGGKPVICATDADGRKYSMSEEFSLENFESFMKQLKAGEIEAYIKSEEVPETQGDVIVAVGKNFDEVVTNSGKDALVEFYAPWCGHCKKLTPIYDELGEKMRDEDVDIVKIDATANDVPKKFNVRGFPTIYWKRKDGSITPYQGGRALDDFVKFIAEESTDELKGFTRSGAPKKSEL